MTRPITSGRISLPYPALSLGVERVLDFVEVWEQDLQDMGMPLLHRRRFMR